MLTIDSRRDGTVHLIYDRIGRSPGLHGEVVGHQLGGRTEKSQDYTQISNLVTQPG